MNKDPYSSTINPRDLEAEDRRQQAIEVTRNRLDARLKEAFDPFPKDSPEWPTAKLILDFLQFVIDNIDEYRNRTRVQNPHTQQVEEAEWVVLCGATIEALEAPERIRRLVQELVVSLIPEEDSEHRAKLAKAAGMHLQARASADDIKALKKKGIIAAFGGKLLVDSKHLIAEHTTPEAEAYFAAARRVAEALDESPFRTERDQRFLDLLQQRFQGGLPLLVDTQREAAITEIRKRDHAYPRLEHTLRTLLERSFESEQGRSIEDWYISARIAFHNENYVFSRLDEFRSRLKKRMSELEQEPMLNPEAVVADLLPKLHPPVDTLEAILMGHSSGLSHRSTERLDIFQIVRQNAALLAKRELVDAFNEFIGDPVLQEHYAHFKLAAFKQAEPDLRRKLSSDMIMWDEIFRSAPLGAQQRSRLATLRERLVTRLEENEIPLPEDIRERKMLWPFGGAILPLLTQEEEFIFLQDWLERVRAVYSDRATSDDELEIPDDGPASENPVTAEAPATPPPQQGASATKRWHPTLVDVSELRSPPSKNASDTSDAPASEDRPRTGWFTKLFDGK